MLRLSARAFSRPTAIVRPLARPLARPLIGHSVVGGGLWGTRPPIPVRHFWNSDKPVSGQKEIVPIEKVVIDVDSEAPQKGNLGTSSSVRAMDAINEDKGLSDFINRTYLFTGAGVTGTLALSQAMSMVQTPEAFLPMLGAGFVVSIGGILGISFSKYSIHQKQMVLREKADKWRTKMVDYWYSKNSPGRILSYGALVTGMSMSMSPMLSMINGISPTILPASVLMTMGVFGGSILYAKFRPKGALLAWEAPLMGGLVGLVGMGLVGLGSQWMFGPNVFSMALHSIDTYGGLLLFTAITAYDTHKAIDMYEKKDPDHLGCSVNLYLDFMNILIRIMEIMAKAQQKK